MVEPDYKVYASPQIDDLVCQKYECDGSSTFSFSSEDLVKSFSYGQNSLGKLILSGSINKEGDYNNVPAYGTSGNISFSYNYFNTFQSGQKDSWNISDAVIESKKINISETNIKTSSFINSGALIIQKSFDKTEWETVFDTSDYFNKKKDNNNTLYTTELSDLKRGTYYRIIVVYSMKQRTKLGNSIGIGDEYNERSFAEVYDLFLCSNENHVEIKDLWNRSVLANNSKAKTGFFIAKNGSSADVVVKKDNNVAFSTFDNATFMDAGKYTISISTTLGKKFTYSITVNSNASVKNLAAKTYDCSDKKGYSATYATVPSAECCTGTHFRVSIVQNTTKEVASSTKNNIPAYGVQGSNIAIYASLTSLTDSWKVEYDNWGKKDSEKIEGATTGEIASGAVIIQKSNDLYDWETIDSSKYSNGLYTTDFENQYGKNGQVFLYSPSGSDIKNGTYYRVLYAYRVKNGKNEKKYLEEYTFYLCSASTSAIRFINKTQDDAKEALFADMDNSTAQMYHSIETLRSGSLTTTGFTINKDNNPKARIYVKRNGDWYANDPIEITKDGRYDITISPEVGSPETVTIYVDGETDLKKLYKRYFGDGFINGIRVYDENAIYPVFEGGQKTKYHIKKISDEYLPLYGTIKNTYTGNVITVEATSLSKSGALSKAGEYEAVFYTNPTFMTDDKSGDNRVFTFNFTVIAEGTAPGPQINQKSLQEYAKTTQSDSYPIYYGLTLSNPFCKGDITYAYSTQEAALLAASNYEEGKVIKQSDGTYRYKGYKVRKDTYESAWDKNDAITYFAEQAVEKMYFDMSFLESYTTLSNDLLEKTKDISKLKLNNDVVLFAEGQKKELTNLDGLPLINDKPYSYAIPDGNLSTGYMSYMFMSDDYKCDSYKVEIIDEQGKIYPIEYNKSVESQLNRMNCPSGVITIKESDIYGHISTYKAIYISNGKNYSELVLDYVLDGKSYQKKITQDSLPDEEIVVDEFSIPSFTDILDGYALIIVKGPLEEDFYCANESIDKLWFTKGTYTIKCVNRLGYSFEIKVNVRETNRVQINFDGASSDGLVRIDTFYNETNVPLPVPERYGYDFIGFKDEEGILYSNEIKSIPFRGVVTLTTTWKPCQISITVIDGDSRSFTAYYGQEFIIPEPILDENTSLDYWSVEGQRLDQNTFAIETTNNITITAIMKDIINTQDEELHSESEKNNVLIILLVIVFIVAVSGGILYFLHLKNIANNHHDD